MASKLFTVFGVFVMWMDLFCHSYYTHNSRITIYSVFVVMNCDNVPYHVQKFYELNVVFVVVYGGGGD